LIGIGAGMGELLVFVAQRDVLHRVSLSTLFIHRHVMWMIPLVECASVWSLCAITGVILVRRDRAWGRAAWSRIAGFLLLIGPILALRGMHPAGACILAAGAGVQVGRVLCRNWDRLSVHLRGLATTSLAGFALYCGWHWDQVSHREERAWSRAVVPASHAPNVLWIVMDTVRADRMSLHGYHRPTTPELERWSKQGVVFDEARSTAPWTLPSHISMFTGLWPFEHRARVDRPYLGRSPLVAEWLWKEGYATAGLVANTGCCNAIYGLDRGFDRYVDHLTNQHITAYAILNNSAIGRVWLDLARRLRIPVQRPVVERKRAPQMFQMSQEWLEKHQNLAGTRPYFLFLNLMDVHGPYRPPDQYQRQFWTDPLPQRIRDTTPEAGLEALRKQTEAVGETREAHTAALEATTRRLSDLYDDCLRYLDAELGRFLDDLQSRGKLDRTWVVITSDHGEHLGEHQIFGHGNSLYNELVHVPLLIIPPLDPTLAGKWDSIRGQRMTGPVSLRNLPATLAHVVMSGQGNPFPGSSLITHDTEQPTHARPEFEPLICQLEKQPIDAPDAVDASTVHTMDAVIGLGRTWIRTRIEKSEREELYDLVRDRRQSRNLIEAETERERVARLRRIFQGILGER
jgi:hypothetical protein